MILEIGILEDNISMAEQLTTALNNWANDHKHIFHIQLFQDGQSMLDSLTNTSYHACFLDIQLDMAKAESETGMDIAKRMRRKNFSGELIFLTSFHEYVFEAYNVNAFNFLLKPVDPEALAPVLSALISSHKHHSYIPKSKETLEPIPYQKIMTISSDLHGITIMTTDKVYHDHTSIGKIKADLPPTFVRCHRSCIVNLIHITKIDGSTMYLTNHLTQTISRNYLAAVKEAYIQYAIEYS